MGDEEILIIDSDDDVKPIPKSMDTQKVEEVVLSDSDSDGVQIEEEIIKSEIQFVGRGYKSLFHNRNRHRFETRNQKSDSSVPSTPLKKNEKIDENVIDVQIETQKSNGMVAEEADQPIYQSMNGFKSEHKSKKDIAIGTEDISKETEDIAIGTEDIAIGTEDIAIGTEDIAFGTEDIATGTEDIANGTEGIAIGTENISIRSEDILLRTEDMVIGGEDISIRTEDIAIETEDLIRKLTFIESEDEELSEDELHEEYYRCSFDDCGVYFNDALLHYKHEKKHLNVLKENNIKTFKCQYKSCHFKGLTQIDLMYHNSEHRGIFLCHKSECFFRGKSVEQVTQHMKSHRSGKKRFHGRKGVYCDCGEMCCQRL